jgi:hypothetical protein
VCLIGIIQSDSELNSKHRGVSTVIVQRDADEKKRPGGGGVPPGLCLPI